MISTSFNSAAAFVLTDGPEWSQSVSLRVALLAQKERGLSGRETRQALGESLRLELSWTAVINRADFNQLRDALQSLGDEVVLCPAWPFALPGANWGDSLYTGSGLFIAWLADWSDFIIGDSIADPADWDFVAPCLVGKLDSTPESAVLGSDCGRVSFSFVEDAVADYALLPDAVAFSNGPALADSSTPKIFPTEADWSTPPKANAAEVMIDRERIGNGRERAATYFPQSAERIQEADVLFTTAADVATILRWWLDRRGSVQAHYAVAFPVMARLATTANAGNNTLTLTEADDLGSNRFVELNDGRHREIVRISSIAGDVCTLTANLARTWPTDTMVRLVMLARHQRESLELVFDTPTMARARFTWRELPAEYTVGAGETRAVTVGGKASAKAFLYLITLDWNGATEVHRCTGYERDLTASSHDWTARLIEHGELRQTLTLDRNETTLKTRWWEGCPFRQFLPNALDAKVTLAIYECDVTGDAGSNVAQIFGGEITGASFDGPIINASAAGANALFDRKFPRFLLQRRCNHALFDAGCTLDRADWTATAEVYSVAGATVTLENFVFSGGTPDGFGFAHWFALGYIQRALATLTPPAFWALSSWYK
jgi:hypothetical protein